jgi:hypothetical protein
VWEENLKPIEMHNANESELYRKVLPAISLVSLSVIMWVTLYMKMALCKVDSVCFKIRISEQFYQIIRHLCNIFGSDVT